MTSFAPFVELFEIDGVNMIGNMDSGAVVGLTHEAMQTCQRVMAEEDDGKDIARVDKRLFAFLEQGGFFDSSPRHDCLLSAYVHVTQRCNLACVGCYSLSSLRNCSQDPTIDELRRIFSQLAANGASNVNISGGEPFLRKDICEIARLAKDECGIDSVNVVTNGTALGGCDLEELARWATTVTVSIDGHSPDSPAYIRGEQRFPQLMDAVREMQDAGIAVRILPTLHSKNIDDVPEYIKLANALGVGLNFSLLSCPPEGAIMADLVPEENELGRLVELQGSNFSVARSGEPFGIGLEAKRTCGAGRKNLSVDVDGNVYPCHMLQSEPFLMGNLLEDDLASIFTSSRDLVDHWLPPIERIESCDSCEYGLVCGGGCRARAINCGAGPCGEDPYCALSKGFYRNLFSALSTNANSSGRR